MGKAGIYRGVNPIVVTVSKVFEAFLLTIAMAFPGKTVAAFTGMSDYPGFNLNWFSL